jgi:diguanylate cyclase (GGDEF)-like protein
MEAILTGESGPHLVLQLLDIDEFKPVNDTFGHQTGDHVLQTVADRLLSLSQDQLVCRLGGDEFAVLQHAKLAAMSASLLIDAINEPIDFKFRHVRVGVSVGMAGFEAQLSSEEFFHRADTALYVSKASGGNCATLYEPGMLMP